MKKIIVERIKVDEKKRITKDVEEINELKKRMKTNKRPSWYKLHCEQENRNQQKRRNEIHEKNKKRLKEVLGI
jgi:hypothetical protein